MSKTVPLFRDDAYLTECEAEVVGINERGGILLDRTVCYATSGGQPGDKAIMATSAGTVPIAATVYDEGRNVVHVPGDADNLPGVGDTVSLTLDWDTRHRYMRAHTCLHLLCATVAFPVTGGSISADGGRLDFDIPDAVLDKDELTQTLNALIAADHEVTTRWITEDELDENPELVRTMTVQPPRGEGRIRLVAIGDGKVDLQPCGGTHVRTTGEIGPVRVTKIEKKGRQNRRIRVAFSE